MTTNKKPVKKAPAKKAPAKKAAPKKVAKKDEAINTEAVKATFVDAQKFVDEVLESVNIVVDVSKKTSLWKRIFGKKKKKK
jgi:hypothetical protein